MKNNNKKGFTLIELLVVVLIIGILAAIALPQYFKAVEKARGAEALSLLGAIAGAQQRFYLTKDSYTTNFSDLDLDFTDVPSGAIASGATVRTKNFTLTLSATVNSPTASGVIAERQTGRYPYTLTKNYNNGEISCVEDDAAICTSLGNFSNSTTISAS